MRAEYKEQTSNTITIEGVIYKTSGNILFAGSEEKSFFLAQSDLLENMNTLLENGIHSFLKKATH
ncbi:hypothetical protein A3H09_00165 [Candidatus Falkowbacteria bacterium RIFCSPLOWO2_12_FULL_45_13]|uniref:Uncharacterized protein n=2 Tax=Bacteria TaxID=2 RepID=A0A1F4RGL2_UNCSA|nr:MAG: hypothetical protein A3J44_03270 [candidate division WOR-1 bacterium RIFCSPHIGHO2_02_FULL_45_12]OGC07317.1 MAG: hypothetical protein A3H38_04530 [candidate division WOR-1 bacterium RIFCSPLOWO2_02_FULL_46_20]OGF32095.1 MAG: hypothetical protein A3H09_00165 [Candidatus Falkowbacteria bacterium RIFCSPLOWO2_12_FULL_45_13]